MQFEIDASGILQVLARDIKTGQQTVVKMKSAVDVEDADVQKMVEESVEHAFEDLKARQWIEAKIRTQETMTATRKGLSEWANELDPDCKMQIEAALAGVQTALAAEDVQTKIGNPNQLKSAAAALDEATQPLADLMMDKAMEAMLRKRGLIKDS